MALFNSASKNSEHTFVKHNPDMLNNFYGTTDVFPYWVADMDFEVAAPISQELARLVKRGVYSYEFNESAVYKSISSWYAKRHDITLSEQNFVQVPGVLSGIALLLRQMTKEGDRVLIHTPAYHQFANLINKANRTVVTSDLIADETKYRIDFDHLEQQIKQQNVKVLIFCNPHNPTGRVWSKKELEMVVTISKRHNVTIISDEIHADIIYDNSTFTSLTNFDYDNIVTLIGSPAKTFGMHSISNGYIYTNNGTMLAQIKSQVSAMYLDHGNAFSTFSTIAAYNKGEQWLEDMLSYLQGTVDWIEHFIATRIPEIKMYRPEGTYQIWFDFSGLSLSDEQLKTLIFNEAKMGLTPGTWFGVDESHFMRMNIATSRDSIETSFELLANAVSAYHNGSITLMPPCQGKQSSSNCCD
ncbi:MalY/PatB family protein [Thalassotalea atypica]|uniref:MalY/PatB family protein n=1 Tax=Thalassotalea atypica TaxID=2054316 RepID=UPI002574122E|nr:PatB family C-S lyase [Thalassotalea atypica]